MYDLVYLLVIGQILAVTFELSTLILGYFQTYCLNTDFSFASYFHMTFNVLIKHRRKF